MLKCQKIRNILKYYIRQPYMNKSKSENPFHGMVFKNMTYDYKIKISTVFWFSTNAQLLLEIQYCFQDFFWFSTNAQLLLEIQLFFQDLFLQANTMRKTRVICISLINTIKSTIFSLDWVQTMCKLLLLWQDLRPGWNSNELQVHWWYWHKHKVS